MTNFYVLLHDGVDLKQLVSLDILKPVIKWHPSSDMNHSVRYIGGVYTPTKFSGKEIDMSMDQAVKSDDIKRSYCLIVLGNADDIEQEAAKDPEFLSLLRSLAEAALYVVSIGSGTVSLARTGLLNGKRAAVRNAMSANLLTDFPDVQWINRELAQSSDEFIHHDSFKYWTVTSDPSAIRKLLLILNYTLRHNGASIVIDLNHDSITFEKNALFPRLYDLAETEKDIKGTSREVAVISQASQIILYLLAEGHLEPAGSIFRTLFKVFPNSRQSGRGFYYGCEHSMEFLWDKAGARPQIDGWRFAAPTEEQLQEWDSRYDDVRWKEENQKELLLETVEVLTSVGAGYPVSIIDVIRVAVGQGKEDLAKRYINLALRDFPYDLTRLAQHRCLANLIISGYVAELTGHTLDMAKADAKILTDVIEDWLSTQENRRNALKEKKAMIKNKSYDEILDMLEPFKWEDHDTLRKPPATDEEVVTTEQRLGYNLPEDYMTFMKVSNGMNFAPGLDMPGLGSLNELDWQDAMELGLVELLDSQDLRFQTAEGVPARLLMISDSGSEVQLWYMEPFDQQAPWQLIYWIFWSPEHVWQGSFQDFMEKFAMKA